MNDRVITVLPTHLLVLGAAAFQKGEKVIGVNQDPCICRQSDHLFKGARRIEISGELRVTIRLSAEMIQGVQQGLRGRIQAGPQVMKESYQGTLTTMPRHGAGRFSRFSVGGAVVVTGRLTIPTADGDLLNYSAVSSEPLESATKAPAAEVAASSCLRRAAAWAGPGLELWEQKSRAPPLLLILVRLTNPHLSVEQAGNKGRIKH